MLEDAGACSDPGSRGFASLLSRRQALHAAGSAGLIGILAACSKAAKPTAISPVPGSSSSRSTAPAVLPPADVAIATPSAIHDVTTYGAIGDGSTDDTAAIVAALTALRSGEALRFPAGKTFCHSDVLQVKTAGVQLLGPGTLCATKESRSALRLEAANVVVSALVLTTPKTTQRWGTPNQHKLVLGAFGGIVVRDVTVKGSAAAGIFSLGASKFAIERAIVSDTRADGIHLTDGSNTGVVVSPSVSRSGDDGVAVVSYLGDPQVCHDIAIFSPTVQTTTGGRGLSVVGGTNISYTDITVVASSAAAVYIACEGGDSVTMPSQQVRVTGGKISDANTNAAIDHGAVLVYSGRKTGTVTNVVISGLTITNTRAGASRQIGVVADNGDPVSGISFQNLTLDASPAPYQGNAPVSAIAIAGVSSAGKAVSA